VCGQKFENGEVFPIQGRFFEANRAVEFHVGEEHGDNLKRLLHEDYTSTVRHQRFMFREKAKQAKLYLAIYEQVVEKKRPMKNGSYKFIPMLRWLTNDILLPKKKIYKF
jgi:hypothetical protein